MTRILDQAKASLKILQTLESGKLARATGRAKKKIRKLTQLPNRGPSQADLVKEIQVLRDRVAALEVKLGSPEQ